MQNLVRSSKFECYVKLGLFCSKAIYLGYNNKGKKNEGLLVLVWLETPNFSTDSSMTIAENEGVYSLLVEMNSLQAKLKLVVFEFKEAQELLTKSLNIANKYGITLLAKRVKNEQTDLSKNYLKWEKLRISRGKISERMDLARIDEQIEILLQKRNYLKSINTGSIS